MDKDSNLIKITEEEILKFDGVMRLNKEGRTSRTGEYSNSSIRISEEDGEYTINTDIRIKYGINIPQLCYDIQTGLIHSLMQRAGIVIKTVNIRIEGIDN